MAVESAFARLTVGLAPNEVRITGEHGSIFEYPACAGHPGSSKHNWVPADFLAYRFARLLHVADEDLKQNPSR